MPAVPRSSFSRSNLLVCGVAVLALGEVLLLRNLTGGGLRERRYATPTATGVPLSEGIARRLTFDSRGQARSVAWDGTLLAPADGEYVFALWGTGRGTLEVRGRTVAILSSRDPRLAQGTIRLPRGPHPIRIRFAGPVITVRWTPPIGSAGPSEAPFHQYLPGEVLSPGRSDEAPAPPRTAAPRRDGFFALLCLGLVALVALHLGRQSLGALGRRLRQDASARRDAHAMMAVGLVGLALYGHAVLASGEYADEALIWVLGRNHWQDLLSLDFSTRAWALDFQHPPFTKYVFGVGALLSDDTSLSRWTGALLGALTAILVYATTRRLCADRLPALLAAGLFLLLPHALAHNRYAGHEPLVLFLLTLSAYGFLRGLQEGRNPWLLVAAVAFGLGVASRQNSATWLAFYPTAFLALRWRAIREGRWRIPWPVLGLLLIATAIFYGLWPYLWSGPVTNLRAMLRAWSGGMGNEWYLGRYHPRLERFDYIWVYFVVTTPLAHLAGLICFLALGLQRERARVVAVLGWLLAPLLTSLGPVQDGIRYAAPAFAPLCVAGGLGFRSVWGLLERGWPSGASRRGVAVLALAAIFGPLAAQAVLYFPYYLDYYNELVGPRRAYERRLFEVGWWCEGLQPAMAAVNRLAPPRATVLVDRPGFCAHIRGLRPDLRAVPDLNELPEFVVRNYLYQGRTPSAEYVRVHVEQVMGAPLADVWRRRTG